MKLAMLKQEETFKQQVIDRERDEQLGVPNYSRTTR